MKTIQMSKVRLQRMLHLDEDAVATLMDSSSWADGLRGIATLGVVSSHIVLCFARLLAVPCCGSDEVTPTLFQRPILRLAVAGHSWVAIFFVLLGFVNALKPLTLARSGQCEAALNIVSVASFRRTFRLVLPSTVATILPWFLCQLGFMEGGRRGNAWWLYTNTPPPSPTPRLALTDLWAALVGTWTFHAGNPYNQPQWTMLPLLQGSLMVFMSLILVIKLTPRWRILVLLLLATWAVNLSFALGDPLVGSTCFAGMIVAEIFLTDLPARFAKNSWAFFIPGFLIKIALVLMSMPSDYPEKASWSRFLHNIALTCFPPATSIGVHRVWGSIGAVLLIVGIVFSPHARRLLSLRPLRWLGTVSFPVFLLHPLFMQTVMPLFAFSSETVLSPVESGETDEDGASIKVIIRRYAQRSDFMLCVAVTVTIACTLLAAQIWTMKIEPLFGKITIWCEDLMTGKKSFHDDMILPGIRIISLTNGMLDLPTSGKEGRVS